MWYHYVGLIIAVYLASSAIYTLVVGPKTVGSLAINGVYVAIGLFMMSWAYSGITAPPPSIFGARRR
jgi:hypothetical protein